MTEEDVKRGGHTKGPWIWAEDYRGLFGAGPENEVLSYAGYEGMWLSHTGHVEANARLIASAPDLYEALRLAADHLHTLYPNGALDGDFLCKTVDAALARARGEK